METPENLNGLTPEAAPIEQQLSETPTESATVENEELSQNPQDEEPGAHLDDKQDSRKNGFNRKVEKMLRRETELKLENEWLRKQLENGSKPASSPQQVQQTQQVQQAPKFSDYNDIDAYTNALTDWKVEQRLQSFEANFESKRQQQTVATTYQQKLAEFEKSHPDFKEVLDEVSDVPISPAAISLITESEIGPELVYEFSKNLDEVQRISRLPAYRQAAELGKLEDRLLSKKNSNQKKATAAPAPVKPLKETAPIKNLSIYDPNISYADFEKLRLQSKRKP